MQFIIIVAEDFNSVQRIDEDTKWDKNSQTERVEGATSSSNSTSSDGTSSITIATFSQKPFTSTKQYVSDSSPTSTSDRSATYVYQNEEYQSDPMISIQAVFGISAGAFTAVCLGTVVVFWYKRQKCSQSLKVNESLIV